MWYIAEHVMKIVVDGDPRNVVHLNLVLIKADTPEDAYIKALKFGKHNETSYKNLEGKVVQIHFEGLSDLDQIYEDLEDGAEITFHERVDVSASDLQSLVLPKEKLRAFLQPGSTAGPDYASRQILGMVKRKLAG